MITQTYNLNLIPDKVPVIVNCSQYDALSRTIEMVLFDGSVLYTIASGVTATVRGTKQDNTGFEYPCTISGSTVSFNIQDQMTIFAGRVPCEIRLIDSNGIIGTCNFLLNVEETPLDPGITISESDLPLLESAEQNAIRSEEAAARSEDEADRAEAEADRAERAVANAVKSVNGELPDANGNVDVVALPDGGTQGQYLVKQSSTDGDADWQTLPTFVQTVNNVAPTNGNVDVEALPTGGTQGQVLTKQSSVDGDADWETPSQGQSIYWGDDVGSSPASLNADRLQGYSVSTLLSLIYPVGAIYQNTTNVNPSTFIPGTTWQLISSVALASEHIFGNGLSIGMTTGSNNITLGLLSGGSGNPLVSGAGGGYGHNVGTSMGGNSGNTQPSHSLGLKTKSALGDYPEYSGLIADTITVYMWERTA